MRIGVPDCSKAAWQNEEWHSHRGAAADYRKRTMDQPEYYKNVRQEMLDFVPRDAVRILEVGCGEGVFGQQLMQRQDAEVWGIEPNPAAAKIAATRLFKAENGFFGETAAAPRNYFDCIVFNDVLEHMENPWQAMDLARSFLRDDKSVVVASIPNFRFWPNMLDLIFQKDFRYADSGILDRTHLRFFTRKSIGDFFSQSGYEITAISGINPTLSRKFGIANLLLLNSISDMQYLQYGVVARPKSSAQK